MGAQKHSFYQQFTVTDPMKARGLYVTAVGQADLEAQSVYPSLEAHPPGYRFNWELGRRLSDFYLAWITDGLGEIQFDGTALTRLAAGSALLLPPEAWHRYRPSFGQRWVEKWVSFNGYFPCELVRNGAIASKPTLIHTVAGEALEAPFDQLIERVGVVDDCLEQQMAAQVIHLLALVLGAASHVVKPFVSQVGHRLVADAIAIINKPGCEAITVDQLVDEMLVARRTLERAFRKQLGHGIHEAILQNRLKRTILLLANRSLSIDEIAVFSGFGNVRSLRRAFAASKGMSPQAYRKLISSDPKAA